MHEIQTKSILSAHNGMNLYRGCTHGCIYCDARSKCYQMPHAFEDVAVKINAPELLERALKSKRNKCMIGTGSMCDPYLPEERRLNLTRRCLELINDYGFGLSILTKSDLILRDLDLLKSIHKKAKCVVQMTLTTYDETLCKRLEPGVCTTKRRTEVLKIMREEGIPTVCWLTPILPFINDSEENLRGLLDNCKQAGTYGVLLFGVGLTLREGNREYFYDQLDKLFPGLKEIYIRTYGTAYEIPSPNQTYLLNMIRSECRKSNIVCDARQLFEYIRSMDEKYIQLNLFNLPK